MSPCRRLNLEEGIRALQAGQVVGYPTEGVWGLGCVPTQSQALRRLLEIKRRDPSKGLILIAARLEDLACYISPLREREREQIMRQEEVVTWLVPARDEVSPLLRGTHQTQAIRVTRHALCQQLCDQLGALVSTSANPEGQPPARAIEDLDAMFGTQLDGVIEGSLGTASGPSEIRDLASGEVRRPGVANE